jgi:hypothetical protein
MSLRVMAALAPFYITMAGAWAADVSEARSTASVSAEARGGVLQMAPGSADILRVQPGVRTIIIGNPEIVDASVINEGTVAVTAKTAGTTNMILLDAGQAEILRTTVQVGPRPRQIQVFSGDRPQAYACAPSCNPEPRPVVPYAETSATTVVRNPDGTEASSVSGTTRTNPPTGAPRTNAPPPAQTQ